MSDTEFEFAFFGLKNDRLIFHPADHVEGSTRLTPQGQFQEVILNTGLEGFLQFGVDLEEPIGGAEASDPLMGPAMVVIFEPEFDAFPGRFEALKLSSGEELAPERSPEAFDLAEGHGMVGSTLEVTDPILFQFGLEPTDTPPGGVLAAVIGEHLLGRLILSGGHPINLDHGVGRWTAEQIGPGDEPGIIVQVGDQVGIPASQPEGEDVALPHLVGGGPFEEPRTGEIASAGFAGRGLHQAGPMKSLTDRLGAGRQEKPSA